MKASVNPSIDTLILIFDIFVNKSNSSNFGLMLIRPFKRYDED